MDTQNKGEGRKADKEGERQLGNQENKRESKGLKAFCRWSETLHLRDPERGPIFLRPQGSQSCRAWARNFLSPSGSWEVGVPLRREEEKAQAREEGTWEEGTEGRRKKGGELGWRGV